MFRNLSIAGKLTLIVVAPITVSLVVAGTILVVTDMRSFRKEVLQSAQTDAEMVATNSTAALTFYDREAAQQILASVAIHEHVAGAWLFDANRELFASFTRDNAVAAPPVNHLLGTASQHRFEEGYLFVCRPVTLEGEVIGGVCIQSDLSQLESRLWQHLSLILSALTFSFVIALLTQAPLRTLITEPITNLARTTEHISRQGDYSVRATKHGTDELGSLVDQFNAMLAQIQERDAALQRTHDQLEERVHERTAELETLIDSSPTGIMVVDAETRQVIRINDRACQMTGLKRDEVLGHPCSAILCEVDEGNCPILDEQREKAMGERFLHRRDGKMLPVLHNVVRVTIGGRPCLLETLTDITDRKRAEENLREAKEATEEANRQLEAAIERANRMAMQAEMANEAKSEFLANMSHEIRTPMNGVIGMVRLLLDTQLSSEQREYANAVCGSAETLLEIINQVLDFSKIEAGRLELEHIPFDLRGLLDEVVDLLALRASKKALQMACLVESDVPPRLSGDPGRLRQVLTNLAGNALKFTEAGEIVIEVSVEFATDTHTKLRFAISDTGIGIPDDRMKDIFDSFSQADSSTTRRYGGTGLGLAISKKLVELMGGEIDAVSEIDVGSTFWFTVTLENQSDASEWLDQLSEGIKGKRVLVVDNHPMQRQALVQQLLAWRLRPHEADSGQAALELLEQAAQEKDAFAMAFVDSALPGMSAAQFAEHAASTPDTADLPLVLLTPIGTHLQQPAPEKGRFIAILSKPVHSAPLLQCLRNTLAPGLAEQAAPGQAGTTKLRHWDGLRVLLAEDNPVNQKVALRMLQKLGFAPEVAATGKQAVEMHQAAPYNIILMDLQMPEMDGFRAMRAIRRFDSGHDRTTFIVALTAHALKGDRERCLAEGMDEYVPKPVHPDKLLRALAQAPLVDVPEPPASKEDRGEAEQPDGLFLRQNMLERLDGDTAFMAELLDLFVQDFPEKLEALRGALEQENGETLARAAHALKGAGANVASERLRHLALDIEKAAKDNQFDAAQSAFEALSETFAQFCAVTEPDRQNAPGA